MQPSTYSQSYLNRNRLPPESDVEEIRDEGSRSTSSAYSRSPLVPVAACVVFGVLLDHCLMFDWTVWTSFLLAGVVAWLVSFVKGYHRVATLLLLSSFFILGGSWHHYFWSMSEQNNIRLLLSQQSQLIKLQGTIISEPVILKDEHQPFRSAWQRYDRSRCVVQCDRVATNNGWQSVTGTMSLNVNGHLLHIHSGQQIEVTGWGVLPHGPNNPGQFDFRKMLKRQGTDALLYANHPDAVILKNETSGNQLSSWLSRLRREIRHDFIRHLSPENVPLAEALLLGHRTSISDDTRKAFAQSGMMHVLAISGLHIGLLAMLVWGICRLLKLSYPSTALLVFVVVLFCVILVEARPPVMRATIFISIALLGKACLKRISTGNLMAFTLLLMLAMNPLDLFDVGAQLSFIAVMGIFFYGQAFPANSTEDAVPPEEIISSDLLSKVQQIGTKIYLLLKRSVLLMGCIWLFSLPMVMSQFHLVSPIGFLLNVLLFPVVVVMLWLGYFFVFTAVLLPWLSLFLGGGFDWGLTLFRRSVQWGGDQWLGHHYVAGPANWWLIGYYVLLMTMVLLWWRVQKRLWLWSVLGSWIAVGLLTGLMPTSTGELRCTFLSVGHGCAVLVELPDGKTLLYDAGSIQDSTVAEHAVENVMWNRGARQLDAIVISHADIDHFNGVPGLLQRVPVGSLLVTRPFLNFDQKSVVHLCESARQQHVPIRLLSANDQLRLDDNVSIKVLHPPASWDIEEDNTASIALEITYAGKTILLLGDVEKEGLQRLMELPSVDTTAILAPHHGSLAANPATLSKWATPKYVIVSSGANAPMEKLQSRYGTNSTLYNTSTTGAVTISISKTGKVKAVTHRKVEPLGE